MAQIQPVETPDQRQQFPGFPAWHYRESPYRVAAPDSTEAELVGFDEFLLQDPLSHPELISDVKEIEYSRILEDNRRSRGTVEKAGATCSKIHRIFEKQIETSG